jgi:hypothetical protein
MLDKEQSMRLMETAGVSGLTRYNWGAEIHTAMQAAYAAGAKDMQERCAKVCDEHVTDAMSKQNDTDALHDVFIRHHAVVGARLAQAIKALETT